MIGFESLTGAEKALLKIKNDYSADDLTIKPLRAEHITINGQDCDLRDPSIVKLFKIKLDNYKDQLKEGTLKQYEGKSTELWKGGRSELLKDTIRLKLAEDYHQGKHTLDWHAQKVEAERISSIRSAQLKAQGM